jgi:hypothetical protein
MGAQRRHFRDRAGLEEMNRNIQARLGSQTLRIGKKIAARLSRAAIGSQRSDQAPTESATHFFM